EYLATETEIARTSDRRSQLASASPFLKPFRAPPKAVRTLKSFRLIGFGFVTRSASSLFQSRCGFVVRWIVCGCLQCIVSVLHSVLVIRVAGDSEHQQADVRTLCREC